MSKLQEIVELVDKITCCLDDVMKDDVNFAGVINDKLEQYARQVRRLRSDMRQVQMYAEG